MLSLVNSIVIDVKFHCYRCLNDVLSSKSPVMRWVVEEYDMASASRRLQK